MTTTDRSRPPSQDDGRGDDGPRSAPLEIIVRLVERLERADVGYCHWKSNEAIARSESGENDLDLLVARDDAGRFAEVLHNLGFRAARPAADRQLPGIVDYYGLDEPTGGVVHVHAHYRLVLGDDMTKNFHLPLEDHYLRSASREGLLRLPSPEFEYVLFVLRMVLKHSPWDSQLDRKGRLTPSERRELGYLSARIRPAEVERLVDAHLPFVGRRLFASCVSACSGGSGRAARAVTAMRLTACLGAHARRPPAVDLMLRAWRRRWRKAQARLPGSSGKKRLDTGGYVVAVVGGDGAGKSSAVDHLVKMLSHDLRVYRSHLGKPPRSRMSRYLKRSVQRLQDRGMLASTTLPAWHEFGGKSPGAPYLLWHTLTARDRYLEYRRIRRASLRGEVVVCDRWPTPRVQLMDGPRGRALSGLRTRPLARWIAAREAAYYAHIRPPDLLVVLKVSPEVAIARRPDQDPDFVRRRAQEVHQADWAGPGVRVVDADAPADEVLTEVTRAVWDSL